MYVESDFCVSHQFTIKLPIQHAFSICSQGQHFGKVNCKSDDDITSIQSSAKFSPSTWNYGKHPLTCSYSIDGTSELPGKHIGLSHIVRNFLKTMSCMTLQ